ncbi:hypothetical protein A2335_03830 [Candidatus Peregrinibacteria bacterium RIFOXYB2_FULL_32_7]|nr:MAG: hypothetical protein A2335_03830 [Candidatus Peregrinibacteria bacterium RIFOXYB2_FULL_32_7]
MPKDSKIKTEEIKKTEGNSVSFDIEANEEDKKAEGQEQKKKINLSDIFKKYKESDDPLRDIFKKINEWVEDLNTVKTKEKATFFRLLSVMINAGIPIVESLNVLANQTKNPKLKRIIINMADDIKNGNKLSTAISKHKDVFNESDIGMVSAGEFSGRLNNILQDIANDTEKSAALRAKIKGALTYPMVVLLILAAAIVALMTMVVPQIMGLFSGSDIELPLATKIMVGLSEFLQQHLFLVILIPIFLIIFVKIIKKTTLGKFYFDGLMLILPIFGQLNKKASLSRFSRILSNLMKSGVSIVEALQISANGIGNEVYKKRIMISSRDTAQGIPLGQNLRGNESLFPSMVVSMIAIGEQTGEIANIMDKIADFYEEEADLMSQSLSKLLEPLILVFVGLSVGGIVAAIMQPIISLTDIADKI